jgi:uncharacterized membrane protein YeaQ/YmgE (transglycosylase-associated protein family)
MGRGPVIPDTIIEYLLNMKLYFSISQIPELAGLTRNQWKAVYRCGLEAFYADHPSRVWSGAPWILGGVLCGTFAGWMVVANNEHSYLKYLVMAAGGLIGALVGVFIGGQILTAQLRPYLRRVLEERKDEIAQIK